MRKDRGLENIHAVIDRHTEEWRIQEGLAPKKDTPSVEEIVSKRLSEENDNGTGKFSADRFLSKSPEVESESPNVEAVEVIKSKSENHSWLYNEVMKAVKDAAGDGRNTKIIAIFVPVVQNGKEFEEIPNVESVTLSPVDEEALTAEDLQISTEEPEPIPEPEPEIITEDITPEPEPEIISEPEPEDIILEEPEPEPEIITEEITPEPEPEPEISQAEDFNLLPETPEEPDAELADAFQTMEEKLDEHLQEQEQEAYAEEPEQEAEPVTLIEEADDEQANPDELAELAELTASTFTEDEPAEELEELQEIPEIIEEEESEENSEGEKMNFSEIPLPPELDDDEVFEDVEIIPDEGDEISGSLEILPPEEEH